ncbi:hypothetical protein OHB54_46350 (plasmid) [Streptomyces sp. NBC_01007]|nr:hypothetical protein OHB54_46350 [Streptomyces sp. NBC_01007]
MSDERSREAMEYGAAIKAAYAPLGLSQNSVAGLLNLNKSTFSRFVTGHRVADQGLIDSLTALMLRLEQPLSPTQVAELKSLRVIAESCGSDSVQLRRAKEALRDSREKVTTLERELQDARTKLAQAQVELERERTQNQGEKGLLLRRASYRENQLRHAGELVHTLEAELAEEHQHRERLEDELESLQRRPKEPVAGETVTEPWEEKPSAAEEPTADPTPAFAWAQPLITDEELAKLADPQGGKSRGPGQPPTRPRGPLVGPLPQPHPWARPGETDAFMKALRKLWHESSPSEDGDDAGYMQHSDVRLKISLSTLPDRDFVADLVSACGANPFQWLADLEEVGKPVPVPAPAPLSDVWRLLRAIGFLIFLATPVFVYLSVSSYVALCRAEAGPPWWALVLAFVPYLVATVLGWFLLALIAAESSSDPEVVTNWCLALGFAACVVAIVITAAGPLQPGLGVARLLGLY